MKFITAETAFSRIAPDPINLHGSEPLPVLRLSGPKNHGCALAIRPKDGNRG